MGETRDVSTSANDASGAIVLMTKRRSARPNVAATAVETDFRADATEPSDGAKEPNVD